MKHSFSTKNSTGMGTFYLLWLTQMFSGLGSSMTSCALIIWSYQQKGMAMTTALLSICSYAPYVLMSIFAGALSDRWDKRRTMLVCDMMAALSTLCIFYLMSTNTLEIWHLYALNAFNGLMNTVQQPASTVAVSLLVPKEHYQRVGGMQAFSNSLITVVAPLVATSLYALVGMNIVILFDLVACAVAVLSLAFFVRIPKPKTEDEQKESMLMSAASGLRYLANNRGILDLILLMALINLIASMYNAALPAMLLSRAGGGETALGILNACTGVAMVIGSVIVSAMPAPKSRVRVIMNTLLISMSTENMLLAIGRSLPVWCIGSLCGWLVIPIMNANMDTLFRGHIPLEMQGRVYSARNTLQFFTIPVGYLLGGLLVDSVLEPLMASLNASSPLIWLLGSGKGSGAALLFLLIAPIGSLVCLLFRGDKHIWGLEKREEVGGFTPNTPDKG